VADAVIYVGGINHDIGYDSEGGDKQGLELPFGQAELIQKLAQANSNMVVVLVGGSPMEMDAWLSKVPAVLLSWYSGMEGGNALAGVLFGDVNPSGKLPATFPKRLQDSPAHTFGPGGFPGTNGTVTYAEGLWVGYRWFDAKDIEPLFPFGYGLSYTTFEYSNLRIEEGGAPDNPTLTVQFQIKNTGPRSGAEVAQVYVQPGKTRLPRPVRELKGFQKVRLQPGETRTVTIGLDRAALAYYDDKQSAWVAERGDYQIVVGASSRDLRLRANYTLADTHGVK
jgi:beta-glucosidase